MREERGWQNLLALGSVTQRLNLDCCERKIFVHSLSFVVLKGKRLLTEESQLRFKKLRARIRRWFRLEGWILKSSDSQRMMIYGS